MSKAIIVVDIPNVEDCEIDSYDMVADLKVKSLVLGGERYDCEFENVIVRPLPQLNEERLKYLHMFGSSDRDLEYYAIGHDDCLDEILGENNESDS